MEQVGWQEGRLLRRVGRNAEFEGPGPAAQVSVPGEARHWTEARSRRGLSVCFVVWSLFYRQCRVTEGGRVEELT